jgi:hypothetical protein
MRSGGDLRARGWRLSLILGLQPHALTHPAKKVAVPGVTCQAGHAIAMRKHHHPDVVFRKRGVECLEGPAGFTQPKKFLSQQESCLAPRCVGLLTKAEDRREQLRRASMIPCFFGGGCQGQLIRVVRNGRGAAQVGRIGGIIPILKIQAGKQAHAGGDRYKIIDALWREKQMRGRDRPGRLNYLWLLMVGAARFELATLCSQSRCATRLRYAPTGLGLLLLQF